MNNSFIEKLILTSRNKSKFFEDYMQRDKYSFSMDLIGKQWFMDESLISIYGTPEYNLLTEEKKKELSYLELCQITYTYAFTEGIMCYFLAKFLLEYPIGHPYYNFTLREQIEEYRHQDMFERSLKILKSPHIPFSKGWIKTMKWEAGWLGNKWFFILQVVVEIISGDFGEKCIENENVYELVRDYSKIHEIEEARHIAFAEYLLDEYFKNAGFISRTWGGFLVLFDVLFINAHYIKAEHYGTVGIHNGKKLRKTALKNRKKNTLKSFGSPRGMQFLKRYEFITRANRRAFKLFLGFSDA